MITDETLKTAIEELSFTLSHIKAMKADAQSPGWRKPRPREIELENAINNLKEELSSRNAKEE